MSSRCVTIVVPVYADWPSLSDCIDSLIKHVDLTRHQVLLVNDCGPDADSIESNIQSSIKTLKNIRYERNPKNLGFVGTCNRAVLELDKTGNDVLLLNSDTKVTDGFLDEMLAVLYTDSKIGVVSPRSNNATLVTVPLSSAVDKGIEPSKSYSIYEKIQPKLPLYYIAPVAHGFCMLIKRSVIKKYGLFDSVFGKGYGEEVDFCRRIGKEGYKSAIANHAYVFHLEARSFSMETKSKLLEKNNQIIWKRYPSYRDEVREYMSRTTKAEQSIERSLGIKTKTMKFKTYFSKIINKISS